MQVYQIEHGVLEGSQSVEYGMDYASKEEEVKLVIVVRKEHGCRTLAYYLKWLGTM